MHGIALVNHNMRNFTAPYEFKEFPKWVTLADGSGVIVHNADEEAVLTATNEDEVDRDALMAQAKELGLNPHHKLGVEKLRELIAQATAPE